MKNINFSRQNDIKSLRFVSSFCIKIEIGAKDERGRPFFITTTIKQLFFWGETI